LFENQETARTILQVFLGINGQMDDAILSVEHKTSPEEYKAFKRGVGHVMYFSKSLSRFVKSIRRCDRRRWRTDETRRG
jgi:hypothetical protein